MSSENARPETLGHPSPLAGDGPVAAIDLGGTKILAAIVGPNGHILSRAKKKTGKDRKADTVIERMADCVRDAAREAGVPPTDLRGLGVGAPGPVDPETGVVKLAPNLGWENVPLREELHRRLSLPVAVGNDVSVAVLAEHLAGAGQGVRHMVGIWPGTGIGGGLVLDGKMHGGAGQLAGEIGHITVKANGPKCGCGGRGHLEAMASRTAIVRDIVRAVKKGEKTALTGIAGKDLARVTSGDLADAWEEGDKLVRKFIGRAAKYLALGIASIANLLNPELVVLGGGLVEGLGDPFVEDIRRHVRSLPLRTSTGSLRIERSALGDDAGISGAAILVRRLSIHRAN